MKDFALKLEGCSKADRKKVIKLAKSVGVDWLDQDRFKDNEDFDSLVFYNENDTMAYCEIGCELEDVPTYQMPQDWNKIQEALRVEVHPEYVEYIGETYCNFINGDTYECIGLGKYSDQNFRIKSDAQGDENGKSANSFKPSTREAFEVQEAIKDTDKITGAFLKETGKLRARLLKKSNRIKELENKLNSINQQSKL